jgi:demethylmenaquinone methyltransferase/2-methoxy-6-polyprenyl-1,4-benzoquinol methylase
MEESTMIEAKAPTHRIRRAYDLFSLFYGGLVAPLERKPRMLSLEKAGIQPHDKVLEVAVGPGATLTEILKRVDRTTVVYGVDLSPKMLEKARRRVSAAGYANLGLQEADARQLPFPDGTFDVLYNSYMLDLIPLGDLPVVLGEFRRVLKLGGRLVLVNMSKENDGVLTWYERLYQRLPARLVPYLLGGCRPALAENLVEQAGFCEVTRDYVRNILPSEIVTARKPGV